MTSTEILLQPLKTKKAKVRFSTSNAKNAVITRKYVSIHVTILHLSLSL